MGLQQKIHFESGLLTVDARGSSRWKRQNRPSWKCLGCSQYQAEKVLFDGRNLKGKPEHIERFYYGYFAAIESVKLMAKYPMRRAPRFAYLINEPLRDPRRYGETVAVNLGMTVKTF